MFRSVVTTLIACLCVWLPSAADATTTDDITDSADAITYTITVVDTEMATGNIVEYRTDEFVSSSAQVLSVPQETVKCIPGTHTHALTGTLTAYQRGDVVFKFHHDLDYTFDCTNVTRVYNQSVYFSNMSSGWQDKGTSKTKSGVGTPHATALGQGDAGRYCTMWGCLNHAHEALKVSLYGSGGHTWTT